MKLDDFNFTLSLLGTEVNTILVCLSKRPYDEVFALIGKLRETALEQLAKSGGKDAANISFEFSLDGLEVHMITSTLNKHPFDAVYQLIDTIKNQLSPQVESYENAVGKE